MNTVKIGIRSQDRAPRVELLVRILWTMVSYVVLWIFGVVALVCAVVQWLYILVNGRRHRGINKLLRSYVVYRAMVMAYSLMVTDERNPIFPES